jgi:hypothetical protein
MKKFLFKQKRKEKNNVSIREEFINDLLPGISKSGNKNENWVKYLRLAIAVVRLAEYDYISKNKTDEDWKSAKRFLFGKNTLFTISCNLLKININMARIKLIASRKAGKVGDPIFESMTNEYTDKYVSFNPTSKDIKDLFN